MRMHYRYGWPMGRLFARLGVPTKILFNVIKDEEAGVFVGTSPDIRGLIVEAETFEALVHEARLLIPEFVHRPQDLPADTVPDFHFRDRLAHA